MKPSGKNTVASHKIVPKWLNLEQECYNWMVFFGIYRNFVTIFCLQAKMHINNFGQNMTFLWHFTVGNNTTSNLHLSWIILTCLRIWNYVSSLILTTVLEDQMSLEFAQTNQSRDLGHNRCQIQFQALRTFLDLPCSPPIILDYVAWLLLVRKLSISLSFPFSPDDWVS